MGINCSDYLFFQKDADFFVYDKKSAYLFPIDSLHFEIGQTLQSTYLRDRTVLDVQFFLQREKANNPAIVREHYAFVLMFLSENGQGNPNIKTISELDIIHSISIVPHIVVEVTERCNFRCNYCCFGEMYDTISNGAARIQDMPEDDCLNCLRELIAKKNLLYSNKTVISFFGGEPFLNFRLIRRIVLFCKEEFPEIEFQFRATTNGTLIKTHIAFLIEHDFHLLVSLDGDEKSNKHRCFSDGRLGFATVKANIDYVYKEHREYFISNIRFTSVLHRDSSIVSICRFFSKYEKTPLLTNLSSEGIVTEKQIVFPYAGVNPQEMSVLYEINPDIYDLIIKEDKNALPINLPFSSQRYSNLRGCFLFENKVFLAADRHIYLCEKTSRKFPFGSFDHGILRFYLQDINGYYDTFRKVVKSECVDCSMHYLCARCFFEGPSTMIPPMKCKMSDIEMKKKLIQTLDNE